MMVNPIKKSVLITGASGFIGRHLTKKITNHVLPTDKNGEKVDLRVREKVLELRKVDVVIHLAGKIPSKQNFSKNVFFDHNVKGTLNILEYCVKKKIKKLIFVSSYVYGKPKYNPIDEKHILQPHNTYTKSKFLAEELCKSYGKKFGIDVIILRPFNIFGNSQKNGFLVSNIIKSMNDKKQITILNKKNKRDYLFIDDLVDAIIKMIDYESKFEIFNVGSGECHTFEELIRIFEIKSGRKLKMKIQTSKINNIPKIQADITKIKKKTGWYPKYNFEDGIEKILMKTGLLAEK